MMKDDDFKLLMGFALGQTDKQTDISECRVAFATENKLPFILLVDRVLQQTELEFKMVTTSFPIEY